MRDDSLLEYMDMPDPSFPIKITKLQIKQGGTIFNSHWHNHIEILFFTKGKALIQCNKNSLEVTVGDMVFINSKDIHYGESICDDLCYYCIIFDTSLFQSASIDKCQTKYIIPIIQNQILFNNLVTNDSNIIKCVMNIIEEYESKQIAYELLIKSHLFRLLSLLLRAHVYTVLNQRDYDTRMKNIERFNHIFKYLEHNYAEKITVEEMASMVNVSKFHFCRIFKEVTGKTFNDYLNSFRLDKAESLLKNTDLNITEIAFASGFNDINYFSRAFKKVKNLSPSNLRKREL